MNKFSITRFLRLCKLMKVFNQGTGRKYALRLFNKPDLNHYKDYFFISLCLYIENKSTLIEKMKDLSIEQKTFVRLISPYIKFIFPETHQYIQYIIRKRIDEKFPYLVNYLSEYALEYFHEFKQEEYSIILNNLFPNCDANRKCFDHFNDDVNPDVPLFDKNVINKLNEENLKDLLSFLNKNYNYIIDRFIRCLTFHGYSKIHPYVYEVLINKTSAHIQYSHIERLMGNIPQKDIDKLFGSIISDIQSSDSLLVNLSTIINVFHSHCLSKNMYKYIWEPIEYFGLEDTSNTHKIIEYATLIFKDEPYYLNKVVGLEVMAEMKEG